MYTSDLQTTAGAVDRHATLSTSALLHPGSRGNAGTNYLLLSPHQGAHALPGTWPAWPRINLPNSLGHCTPTQVTEQVNYIKIPTHTYLTPNMCFSHSGPGCTQHIQSENGVPRFPGPHHSQLLTLILHIRGKEPSPQPLKQEILPTVKSSFPCKVFCQWHVQSYPGRECSSRTVTLLGNPGQGQWA